MAIDGGFDFLGMHLEAADVDDSAAASEKVVALAATLHHVAGIDESVGVAEGAVGTIDVAERRALRAEAERSGVYADTHVSGCADQARRKPGQPIVNLEADAGLGGGKGVHDARAGVARA